MSLALTTQETEYISFDGTVRVRTRRCRPDRYRFFDNATEAETPMIARGAGLSYAAASFGGGAVTIEHRSFNRLVDLDTTRRRVRVEAGISLGELYAVLEQHGLFLPVQPGHPNITVGGCTATDAHGKSHSQHGTFSNQVHKLSLFHPRHGVLELSRDQDADAFELTCGGYGLTGSILQVELEVQPAPRRLETHVLPVGSLADLPERLAAAEREWDYIYSWHDLAHPGGRWGSGYLRVARAAAGPMPGPFDSIRPSSLSSDTRGRLCLPLFGRPLARLVGEGYGRVLAAAAAAEPTPISLFAFQFPIRSLELYFLLFGRRGFFEHQVLIPLATFPTWVERVHDWLRRHPFPVTLGSGKLFRGTGTLLRFSGEGVCFAVNLPRRRGATAFLAFLDKLALATGARPNLIKDSRLAPAVVSASYPDYELFRVRRAAFDSGRLCRSELSERLRL